MLDRSRWQTLSEDRKFKVVQALVSRLSSLNDRKKRGYPAYLTKSQGAIFKYRVKCEQVLFRIFDWEYQLVEDKETNYEENNSGTAGGD